MGRQHQSNLPVQQDRSDQLRPSRLLNQPGQQHQSTLSGQRDQSDLLRPSRLLDQSGRQHQSTLSGLPDRRGLLSRLAQPNQLDRRVPSDQWGQSTRLHPQVRPGQRLPLYRSLLPRLALPVPRGETKSWR